MRIPSLHTVAAAVALLASASLAQADTIYHDPYADFTTIAGSLATDGWNELNRPGLGCADTACSTAALVAGITANVYGSGDAVLKRVSGSVYPAGSGLYGDGVLTFTDQTLAAGIGKLVFQGAINNFDTAPFGLTLSYNGGSQALAATSSLLDGSNHYTYTWDLSGLAEPLNSYTLTLSLGFTQSLAFQVDQVAAVPEAGTTAMMLAGLGVLGFVGKRRLRA